MLSPGRPPGLQRPGFLPRKGSRHRGQKKAAARDEESHKGHTAETEQ